MKPSVLITGGMGYVGGRVALHLAQAGYGVVVSSRQPRALPPALAAAGVRAVTLPLDSIPSVMSLPDGITDIVHLAAPNEILCGREPLRTITETLGISFNLVDAAVASGVRRFVFFSTAHVYGSPLQGHITEDLAPRPVHPYAIAHRAAEDVVLAAAGRGRLEPVVVRLSNGFGPPVQAEVDRWSLLVNDLCRQAVVNGRLVLKSSGLQVRDFVCLADVARATEHLLAIPTAAVGKGLFNLGSGTATTVFDMAQRIQRRAGVVLGSTPALERPEPAANEQPGQLHYDCSRLQATGFELNGDVDAEIDGTLALCRQASGARP